MDSTREFWPASDVAELIAAAPDEDRAIWACAFYAGLRLGELRALRVDHVGEHSIDVEYGWDPKEGRIDPKSKAGVREVPIPEILREILDAHIKRTGRSGDEPSILAATSMSRRSIMLASESRADRYAGHSDGRVANRYRHLLEGQLVADAQQLNEYLIGATTGKVVPLPSAGQLRASAGQSHAV